MSAARTAKQTAILEAAATLLGERPAETVTMDEIAKCAGVAKGTLYLYFASKDELVRELLASRLGTLVKGILAQPDPRRAIDFAFRYQVSAPDWFRLRRRAAASATARAFLREHSNDLSQAMRTALAPLGRAELECPRDADFTLGTIEAAVGRCIGNEAPPDSIRSESIALWRFLRSALRAPGLRGRCVLVTREETEDGPLSCALRARGAQVHAIPLLETRPPEDPTALDAEMRRLSSYDWVVLTSVRAARALGDVPAPNGRLPRFAVVGESTARVAQRSGWPLDVVGHGGAVELAGAMCGRQGCLTGKTVLFPASDRVREESVRALVDTGADVHVVTAYQTVPRPEAAGALRDVIRRGTLDSATFASPSAVDVFFSIVDPPEVAGLAFAAIGPTTKRRLVECGINDVIVPEAPDFEDFADALADALSRQESDRA